MILTQGDWIQTEGREAIVLCREPDGGFRVRFVDGDRHFKVVDLGQCELLYPANILTRRL